MSYTRRLPVYLLVDTSESMVGEPIEAVAQGIAALMSDLRGNPMALETAALSVITFASQAKQVVPLTDVLQFQVPKLQLGTGTALGAALQLWMQCMDREVVKTTPDQKGDWKPICFIITDGEPTDNWAPAADMVRTQIAGKKANVIAVACGSSADTGKLKRITETVILAKDVQPDTFSGFFKWVSASVTTASKKLETAGEKMELPPLAAGLEMAPAQGRATTPEEFVFLHAKCVSKKLFYLMRFGKKGNAYEGVASHAVDDFDVASLGAATGSKVNANLLLNNTPCPYCGNKWWGMCIHGHVHCCPEYTNEITLTCPWCDYKDTYRMGSFDVGKGLG